MFFQDRKLNHIYSSQTHMKKDFMKYTWYSPEVFEGLLSSLHSVGLLVFGWAHLHTLGQCRFWASKVSATVLIARQCGWKMFSISFTQFSWCINQFEQIVELVDHTVWLLFHWCGIGLILIWQTNSLAWSTWLPVPYALSWHVQWLNPHPQTEQS